MNCKNLSKIAERWAASPWLRPHCNPERLWLLAQWLVLYPQLQLTTFHQVHRNRHSIVDDRRWGRAELLSCKTLKFAPNPDMDLRVSDLRFAMDNVFPLTYLPGLVFVSHEYLYILLWVLLWVYQIWELRFQIAWITFCSIELQSSFFMCFLVFSFFTKSPFAEYFLAVSGEHSPSVLDDF